MNPLPTPTPRQVASQWYQRVWNERDESAIDDLMSSTAQGELEGGVKITDPEDFKKFFRALSTLFPDLYVTLVDLVEEGEKVVVRWEASGTHAGDGMGMRATHARHTFRGMTWMIVRDGKIVDGGDSWNQDGLLARMAAAPVAAASPATPSAAPV